jgi:hypothetical protein
LDSFDSALDYIYFFLSKTSCAGIIPIIVDGGDNKVIKLAHISQCAAADRKPRGAFESA